MGDHSGFPETYRRVRQLFFWPKMKTHILQFVYCCQVCQHAKPGRLAYPGLWEPLHVPKESSKPTSVDWIELLQLGQYNCILVIVDKVTKLAQFLPLAHLIQYQRLYYCIWLRCTRISDSLELFSRIMIQFLLVIFGKNFSSTQAKVCVWARQTTPKPMGRPKGSISAWRSSWDVSHKHAQRDGGFGSL